MFAINKKYIDSEIAWRDDYVWLFIYNHGDIYANKVAQFKWSIKS